MIVKYSIGILHSSFFPESLLFHISVHPAKHSVVTTEHLAKTLLWGRIKQALGALPCRWHWLPAFPRPQKYNKKDYILMTWISVWGESQQRTVWMMSACVCTDAQHGQCPPSREKTATLFYLLVHLLIDSFIYWLISLKAESLPSTSCTTSKPHLTPAHVPHPRNAVFCTITQKSCGCAPWYMEIWKPAYDSDLSFGLWGAQAHQPSLAYNWSSIHISKAHTSHTLFVFPSKHTEIL